MAERFQKTYISVHEFIHSWEKEIYELNNLDYFTYLLINNLGYQIEHEFFSKKNKYPYLEIEYDEISTLSFNIGDSFESYIEFNYYSNNIISPIDKTNEKFYQRKFEKTFNQTNFSQIINNIEINKSKPFLSDILNFVVIDSLYDFYNYEIGLDLNDSDVGLMYFAEFITNIIVKLLEINGKLYLQNPTESATNLFDKLLQETNDNWAENIKFIGEDEEDESELWKNGTQTVTSLINNYINHTNPANNNEIINQLLNYLREFTEDYAGITQIDDINKDDLYEFFSFWIMREIIFENYTNFNEIYNIYNNFFSSLEISHNINLKKDFDQFYISNCTDLDNVLHIANKYLKNHSLIDSLIESNKYEAEILNGFFEVVKVLDNGLIRLKDIHFHREYYNVQINIPIPLDKLKSCIIDGNLRQTLYGWCLVNIDYIYPKIGKPYIH